MSQSKLFMAVEEKKIQQKKKSISCLETDLGEKSNIFQGLKSEGRQAAHKKEQFHCNSLTCSKRQAKKRARH